MNKRVSIPVEYILFTLVNYGFSCPLCKLKDKDNEVKTHEGLCALISINGGSNLKYLESYGYSCLTKYGQLEIHHINPVEQSGKNELINLIPLCVNCHDFIHRRKVTPRNVIDSLTQFNKNNVDDLQNLIHSEYKYSVLTLLK